MNTATPVSTQLHSSARAAAVLDMSTEIWLPGIIKSLVSVLRIYILYFSLYVTLSFFNQSDREVENPACTES